MNDQAETSLIGIEAAAQRSGLTQHLIRIWERRYGAVQPSRTKSNRRLYSEDDVRRLELMNRAVQAGHRIGDIASLPTSRLEQLAGRTPRNQSRSSTIRPKNSTDYVKLAIEATETFDSETLGAVLSRADVELGQMRSLEHVVMPFMQEIGAQWKNGTLRIAHEHMATAGVRHHVGAALASLRLPANSPSIVIATPVGQLHEVGALTVAVASALEGWQPVYLGPNLPADEIAGAVVKTSARAVALSIVYPADDPHLPAELTRLRRLISPDVLLVVGGRAMESYRATLESIKATRATDIAQFREQLDRLRTSRKSHRQTE